MSKDTGELILKEIHEFAFTAYFEVYLVFVYSPTSPVFAEPVTYVTLKHKLVYCVYITECLQTQHSFI